MSLLALTISYRMIGSADQVFRSNANEKLYSYDDLLDINWNATVQMIESFNDNLFNSSADNGVLSLM